MLRKLGSAKTMAGKMSAKHKNWHGEQQYDWLLKKLTMGWVCLDAKG